MVEDYNAWEYYIGDQEGYEQHEYLLLCLLNQAGKLKNFKCVSTTLITSYRASSIALFLQDSYEISILLHPILFRSCLLASYDKRSQFFSGQIILVFLPSLCLLLLVFQQILIQFLLEDVLDTLLAYIGLLIIDIITFSNILLSCEFGLVKLCHIECNDFVLGEHIVGVKSEKDQQDEYYDASGKVERKFNFLTIILVILLYLESY